MSNPQTHHRIFTHAGWSAFMTFSMEWQTCCWPSLSLLTSPKCQRTQILLFPFWFWQTKIIWKVYIAVDETEVEKCLISSQTSLRSKLQLLPLVTLTCMCPLLTRGYICLSCLLSSYSFPTVGTGAWQGLLELAKDILSSFPDTKAFPLPFPFIALHITHLGQNFHPQIFMTGLPPAISRCV